MANTQTGIHSEKQGYGRPKRRINLLLGIENTKRWLATKPKKEGVTDEWLFSHILDVHEKYCTCRCSPVVEMDAKRTPTDQFKQVLQSKHHILPYDRNQLFRSEEITEDTDNLGVNGSVLLNQPVSNSDTCENQTELPQKGTVANTPWRVQTTKNVNVVQPPRLDSLVSTGNLRHTGEPDKSKLIRLTVLPTPAAGDVQLRHSQQAVPMISVLNLNGNKKETNINIPDVNNVPLLAAINQHQVKQSEFQCEDSNRHGISKSFSTSSSAEETGVPVVKNVSAPVTVSQVPQQNQIFSGLSLLRTADVTSVPVGTNRTLQHLLLQTSPGQQGKQSSPQLTMLRRVVIDPNSSSVPVRTSKATSSGNAQISYVKQIHTSPHTMTSSADPLLREDDISFGNSTTTQIPNSVNVVTQAMQVIPPNVTVLRQSVVSNSCAVPGVSIVTNSAASDSARNWSTGDQETTTDVKPELSMLLDDSYVGNENIEPFRKSSSCGVITKQPNSSLNVEPYNIKFLLFPKELNNGDKIGDKLKFSQHPSMNLMAKGMTRSSALNPPDEGPGSEKKMYILNFLEMYFTAKMMEQQGIPMKVSGKVYRNMYIILQTWLHVFYGIKVSSSAVKSKCDKVFTRFCVHEEHYNKTSCKESFNTLCRFLSKSISSIWFSDLTKSSEEHEEIDPSGSSHQENDTQGNSEFDFRVYRVFHDDEEEEDMKPDITEEERPDPEKESSMAPQNWEMVFPIKQEPEEWTSAVYHSVEQNLPNDDSPVNLLPKEEELDSDSESRHSDLNPGNMRKSENDHLSEAEQDQLSGSSQMTQLDQDQPSVPSGPDQGNSDSIKENLSAQNKSSRSKYLTQPKDQSLDSNDVIQTKRKETSVSDQFKPGRRHLEPRGKRKKFAEDFTLLFKSDSEDDDSISEACQPERDEEVHRKRKQKRVSEDFVELLDSEDEYLPPEERIQDHNKRKRFAEHSNLVQLDSASESMSKDEDDDDKNEDDDVKNDDDVYNDEDDNEVNSRAPHKGGKLFNKLGQVVRYNEEFKQEVVAYAISTNFSAAAKKFDIQRDRIRVWKKKMTFLQDDDLTKGDDVIAGEEKDNPLTKSFPKRRVGRPKKTQNTDNGPVSLPIELVCEEFTTCKEEVFQRRRGQCKQYTLKERQEAVRLSYELGTPAIERLYNLPHSTLMNWRKCFSDSSPVVERDMYSGRKIGSGRNFFSGKENEEHLVMWLKEKQDLQIPVSRESFMTYARELVNKKGFKASRLWLSDFLKRNLYSWRTRTPQGHRLPQELEQRVMEFTQHVQEIQLKHKFELDCVINMDETNISYDVIQAWAPQQNVEGLNDDQNTFTEKMRVTFALAITASGETLPPMVIFKGRRQVEDSDCMEGVVRRVQDHGQMDSSLMVDWLLNVVKPHTNQRPTLMVLDSFSEHMTEKVQAAMKQCKITPVFIPAGCTSKVQPLNVSIRKSFKLDMVKQLSLYIEQQTSTPGCLTTPPTEAEVMKWVQTSWDTVTDFPALIKHSFGASGIVTFSEPLELPDLSDLDSEETLDLFVTDDFSDAAFPAQ